MATSSRVHILPVPLITGRGFAILAAGMAIPVIGVIGDVRIGAVIGLLLLFFVVYALMLWGSYIAARAMAQKITMTPVLPPSLYSGVPFEIEWHIDARGIDEPLRAALRPINPPSMISENDTFPLSLEPNTACARFTQEVLPTARGTAVWQEAYGRIRQAPFTCAWQFRLMFAPRKVLVQPNARIGGETTLIAQRRLGLGEVQLERVIGTGREFHSLRRYYPGDELRKIDWKRSARGNGLFVKNYRFETHQRIHLAFDCGRRMGNRIDSRLQIEHAADGAAHLVLLARAHQDEVGLFAFSHKVAAKIECQKGRRQEQRIIDTLTGLEIGELESDYQLLTEWAKLNRRRSMLILITSISNPSGLEFIRSALLPIRHRHLPVVFAIADRDLQKRSLQAADSLADAYIAAAAREQLAEIEHGAELLNRSGIHCVYCDAAELPLLLRTKYLELKRFGRL